MIRNAFFSLPSTNGLENDDVEDIHICRTIDYPENKRFYVISSEPLLNYIKTYSRLNGINTDHNLNKL